MNAMYIENIVPPDSLLPSSHTSVSYPWGCSIINLYQRKKAIKLLETFEHKPEKYAQKVNNIFEVLGQSLYECCDMIEKLYNEVKEIALEINK